MTIPELDQRQISIVAELLGKAKSVLFVTGAGISADSGLPTYRGVGGLYDRELTEEGIPIEVALSGSMLRTRPEVCWKYIAEIERACRGARHNRAHEIIAAFESVIDRVWVLTQNVDGFHRDAGSKKLIEIHGNIHELSCTECSYHRRVADFAQLEIPPHCPECGALLRPDVVLFGELLPEPAVQTLTDELDKGFDLVVSVGTSSAFPYIVEPVLDARRRGKATVEINPAVTELSPLVDVHVRARALPAFEALWAAWQRRSSD